MCQRLLRVRTRDAGFCNFATDFTVRPQARTHVAPRGTHVGCSAQLWFCPTVVYCTPPHAALWVWVWVWVWAWVFAG